MSSEKSTTSMLSAEDKLFEKNKWFFSVGCVGRDMVYCIVSSFLLTYIQFGHKLSIAQFTTISIVIGVLGRVWDGVNDPIMGAIVEGSHMKWGKFKPWILIGAIGCGIATFGLFNIRPTGWTFVSTIIVLYLLWESFFTVNDIGYWAMLPSLSSKKEQRNTLTMMTVLCSGIGGFAMTGMISLLSPGNILNAYTLFSIIAAVGMIAFQTMTAFCVKEKERPASEAESKVSIKKMWYVITHNDQLLWMALASVFYNIGSTMLTSLAYNLYYLEVGYDGSIFIFLVIFAVGNLGIQTLYPAIAKKYGRKKLQTFTTIFIVIGYLGALSIGWTKILPFNLFTLSFFGIFIFIGQALFYISMMVNMLNCVEYNEYKNGTRSEAIISTMRPFIVKLSDAVRYGVVTIVLTVSGVFLLSQNISAIETQVNYFNKTDAASITINGVEKKYSVPEIQKIYIENVRTYVTTLQNQDPESTEYKNTVTKIQDELNNDEVMFRFKLDAAYLVKLSNIQIYQKGKRLGSLMNCNLEDTSSNFEMVMMGSYKDESGKEISFNIGDENFTNKANIKMRLFMRLAAAGIPALFILIAYLIQRKHFIIDEKYYDFMMNEIKKREEKEKNN